MDSATKGLRIWSGPSVDVVFAGKKSGKHKTGREKDEQKRP